MFDVELSDECLVTGSGLVGASGRLFIMVIIGGSAAGYTCWVGADVVVVGLY